MMTDPIGTYVHIAPTIGVFYVGKGKRSRAFLLNRKAQPSHKNIVDKYGRQNIIVIFHKALSEKDAIFYETFLIDLYKDLGYTLVNKSKGGGGAGVGHVVTKETREKIGKKLKGRVFTKEWRDKLKESHKGKVVSEETRRILSEKGKKRKISEEHKEKLRKAFTGRKISKQQRDKISATLKGRPANPDRVKKSSETFKKLWATEAFRAKMALRKHRGKVNDEAA